MRTTRLLHRHLSAIISKLCLLTDSVKRTKRISMMRTVPGFGTVRIFCHSRLHLKNVKNKGLPYRTDSPCLFLHTLMQSLLCLMVCITLPRPMTGRITQRGYKICDHAVILAVWFMIQIQDQVSCSRDLCPDLQQDHIYLCLYQIQGSLPGQIRCISCR